MSIEQAIHEKWSSCRALLALVPAARLFTGQAPAALGAPTDGSPYVTLERQGDAATERTSAGQCLSEVVVRFDIWSAALDDGKRIGNEMFEQFNRADFASSQGKVLDARRTNRAEAQEADGVWRLMHEYRFLHVE